MTKHIRHLWAKADQHIRVHRHSHRPNKEDDQENGGLMVIIVLVVLIWLFIS